MSFFTQPLRRAPFIFVTASSVAGAVSFSTMNTVHLDQLPPSPSKKLSIYPKPDVDVLLVETHSELERQIGHLRVQGSQIYDQSRETVQSVISRWIGVEEAVENKVKEIIPNDENLTPGILYVGVTTLAGSVFARNRSFPVRLALPPTLLLLALPQCLPKTSANLSAYFSSLEQTYAPSLATQHTQVNTAIASLTHDACAVYKNAVRSGWDGVQKGLEKAEEWSGLKIGASKGDAPTNGGNKAVVIADSKTSDA